MPDERWHVQESRTLYENRWLRLREDHCILPDGTELPHPWFVLDKDDYVLVVAVTAAQEAVLVRLYKHGAGAVVTECPAGFIDPGEAPADAARRELREETGYLAQEVIPISVLYASPSVLSNRCHIFWCPDLTERVPPNREPSERMEVLLVPWAELLDQIQHGQGLSDVSSMAACLLVNQRHTKTWRGADSLRPRDGRSTGGCALVRREHITSAAQEEP
ncbi:MAG: NUDIX hydrolase [Chloroflexi bacterium]|nr:NUDIX hydrolase [Chloroflexota bacterium]MBU1747113.1 NUDIX hydrolase [Chloroflexota bacterium]